jgi:hypothetical protein
MKLQKLKTTTNNVYKRSLPHINQSVAQQTL